ncbi:dTMP kinase [Cereibacter sphaeroides]|uniref:dTMP kinase n=1 Tax=Cereibacter sphaeroides TaxID=1063 RepID=UPI001F443F62|nr:dTMP kinase [Cereibacter sphaeroides]MCE6959632.1 dTMP kinase [Cereibacter sphaeroides]MCE6974507.1 dTMP kinase [Cereibacter sphaeroides]
MFITFEGVEGAGKSSRLRDLADDLRALGHEVVMTREPGGTAGAEEIRNMVLQGEAGRWSAETEILLFNAARRDHCEKVIRPAMERGAVILCDRFVDSTRAIQGAARASLLPLVEALHREVIGLDPDLTLILDIDPRVGLARTAGRLGIAASETRFEEMGLAFHQRVRAGLHDIAAAHPGRCRMIDGSRTPEEIRAEILSTVLERLVPTATPTP